MLEKLGVSEYSELFQHIDDALKLRDRLPLPEELTEDELKARMESLAATNKIGLSLIGDGLSAFTPHPVVKDVATIRTLTTAYTPYQPERSQGTLITHWLYQCTMASLTGFEAINASLYDRSTAIYEAVLASFRLQKNASTVLISDGIYPGDKAVIQTHASGTENIVDWLPLNASTGLIDMDAIRERLKAANGDIAAVVFPQVNCLGYLEDVDMLTDLCAEYGVKSIAVIDPMHLGEGGLKGPVEYGTAGADIIVGEAQSLALNACFGGPGLGLFGVRMDDARKNDVRITPGRYVGKAKDVSGRDCFVAVMSAREQHIRKDRATSNICSNQAFLASMAGASVLARGSRGLGELLQKARQNITHLVDLIINYEGFELAFAKNPYLNEATLAYKGSVDNLINRAADVGIHLGVNVSDRIDGDRQLIKISCHDQDIDWGLLTAFLDNIAASSATTLTHSPDIPNSYLRQGGVAIPRFEQDELIAYYQKLGELNISPDTSIYPLGSCTMKYNPLLNDWAAALDGFQTIHPQAPISSVQGCLEVLYEIQQWMKGITGLPGVTTQPVAGAQGELVGIKMFQAYHAHHGQSHRDIIMVPTTAHGTNFATAIMAGYSKGRKGMQDAGIVLLNTDSAGGIDMADFEQKMDQYGDRLVGVMITNPNTCGIFESDFAKVAEMVHEAGGLVYMDGANMNAIAGWLDLDKLGVDAVHNNLHKTWSIPHGGGGPGDGIVAVSEKLLPFMPGYQIEKTIEGFIPVKPEHSIGTFHRHWGNFNHKIRCLSYLYRLGRDGIKRMSAMSIVAARYLLDALKDEYVVLPAGSEGVPRMHEFILTLKDEDWELIKEAGVQKTMVMTGVGKLFLDFGYHAPTIAWPEPYGIMFEPTESYTSAELDRFVEVAKAVIALIRKRPKHYLEQAPFFTPVDRVNEVEANRSPTLSEPIKQLPALNENRIAPSELLNKSVDEIVELLEAT